MTLDRDGKNSLFLLRNIKDFFLPIIVVQAKIKISSKAHKIYLNGS